MRLLLLFCILTFIILFSFKINITEQNRARTLVYSLLASLLFPQVVRQDNPGVFAGGSATSNLFMMGIWIYEVFLLCILTFSPDKQTGKSKKKNIGFLLSWSLIFVLKFFEVALSPTKILPLISTLVYITLFVLLYLYPIQPKIFISVFTNCFALLGVIMILSFILRVPWFGLEVENYSQFNMSESAYWSPLNLFFGLPNRLSGPFAVNGGVNIAGLFFGLAQICNGLRLSQKYYILYTFIFFFAGGATGSRAFYLIFIVGTFLAQAFDPVRNNSRSGFKRGAIVIFSISISIVSLKLIFDLINKSGQSVLSGNGRSQIYSTIWHHWSDKGLAGQMPGNFTEKFVSYGGFAAAHAHNSFFEYLWNFGLLGAFAFIGALLSLLFMAWSVRATSPVPVVLLLGVLSMQAERTLFIGMAEIVGFTWLLIVNSISYFQRAAESRILR